MTSAAAAGSHTCQCFVPPARIDGSHSAAPTPPSIIATPHATTSLRNSSPHRCPNANP